MEFPRHRIFNFDGSGISTTPNDISKVISPIEVEKWMVTHPGLAVAQSHFSAIFRESYNRISTVEIAVKGLKTTGT
ncbi:uncharacterized protein LOC124556321 [Schistocerca americana]|uniref:uncharacterized protein LOC124556321 n=1 Tax=Schistocerca americana TaxID=7009 RepID=UPI001F5034C1|nr:uncharacterized protein LOC124556321 [Schistocerca americana]